MSSEIIVIHSDIAKGGIREVQTSPIPAMSLSFQLNNESQENIDLASFDLLA